MANILLSALHTLDHQMDDHLTGLHDENPHFDSPFIIESGEGFNNSSYGSFLAPQQQRKAEKEDTQVLKNARKTKPSEMKVIFPQKQ